MSVAHGYTVIGSVTDTGGKLANQNALNYAWVGWGEKGPPQLGAGAPEGLGNHGSHKGRGGGEWGWLRDAATEHS